MAVAAPGVNSHLGAMAVAAPGGAADGGGAGSGGGAGGGGGMAGADGAVSACCWSLWGAGSSAVLGATSPNISSAPS